MARSVEGNSRQSQTRKRRSSFDSLMRLGSFRRSTISWCRSAVFSAASRAFDVHGDVRTASNRRISAIITVDASRFRQRVKPDKVLGTDRAGILEKLAHRLFGRGEGVASAHAILRPCFLFPTSTSSARPKVLINRHGESAAYYAAGPILACALRHGRACRQREKHFTAKMAKKPLFNYEECDSRRDAAELCG